MLGLESLIVDRLKGGLSGWQVKGVSSPGQRSESKTAVVAFEGAEAADAKPAVVRLAGLWSVLLVVRRSDTAAADLDAALADAIAALHHWQPPTTAARSWERLAFQRTEFLPEGDDGLLGLNLIFRTAASYAGGDQPKF